MSCWEACIKPVLCIANVLAMYWQYINNVLTMYWPYNIVIIWMYEWALVAITFHMTWPSYQVISCDIMSLVVFPSTSNIKEKTKQNVDNFLYFHSTPTYGWSQSGNQFLPDPHFPNSGRVLSSLPVFFMNIVQHKFINSIISGFLLIHANI